MRPLKIIPATWISVCLLSTSAQAGGLCTTPQELAALRTAAVQQELMVAGFTCQASDAYNRFVLAYRPELQRSDADLKAYFLRRSRSHGEADYDTFKTKLANLSSLSDVTNGPAYCASTRAAFAMAFQSHQSLDRFVADQRLLIALPEQQLCAASPAVNMASAGQVAVAGVPRHDLPASPYGSGTSVPIRKPAPPPAPAAYPPQQGFEDQDSSEDYDDNDNGQDTVPTPPSLPPSPPPVIQAERGPVYRPAGWPPGWGPQPYPRWGGPAPYPYPYYYGR